MLAQAIAYIFSLLLAKRIRALQVITDRLLDARLPEADIPQADDELGILNQSLLRMATRIHELVDRLSLESGRREAILGRHERRRSRRRQPPAGDLLQRFSGTRARSGQSTPCLRERQCSTWFAIPFS